MFVAVRPSSVLVLAPATVDPGDTVTVRGTGFDGCLPAEQSVALSDQVALIALDDVLEDTAPIADTETARGGFSGSFAVPGDLAPGAHVVVAVCRDPGRSAGVTATATLPVRDPAEPSPTAVPVRPIPGGTGGVRPGGGSAGSSVPHVPSASSDGLGTAFGVGGAVVMIAVLGAVSLRRRLRPAGR